MKTASITLTSIKDSDSWYELAYNLLFDTFMKENPNLKDDDLQDAFYTTIVSKIFKYGEYADIEITVDENLNIVGGKIIPSGK